MALERAATRAVPGRLPAAYSVVRKRRSCGPIRMSYVHVCEAETPRWKPSFASLGDSIGAWSKAWRSGLWRNVRGLVFSLRARGRGRRAGPRGPLDPRAPHLSLDHGSDHASWIRSQKDPIMDQKEHFHAVSPLNAPTICWHHLLGQSAGKYWQGGTAPDVPRGKHTTALRGAQKSLLTRGQRCTTTTKLHLPQSSGMSPSK